MFFICLSFYKFIIIFVNVLVLVSGFIILFGGIVIIWLIVWYENSCCFFIDLLIMSM